MLYVVQSIIDAVTHNSWYLEGDLWSEDELVALKQSPARVHEHQVGDAINEVHHSLFHILRCFSTFNCIVKHHTEGLQEVYSSMHLIYSMLPGEETLIILLIVQCQPCAVCEISPHQNTAHRFVPMVGNLVTLFCNEKTQSLQEQTLYVSLSTNSYLEWELV